MIFFILYWTAVLEIILLIFYDEQSQKVDFYISRSFAADNPSLWRLIRAAKHYEKTIVDFNREMMKVTLTMAELNRVAKDYELIKGRGDTCSDD